jgi:hypothetical protein
VKVERWSDPRGWAALFAVLAIGVYWALHLIYRPENVDDAWVTSYVYGYFKQGIEQDVAFKNQWVVTGVELFGKTFAFLYGALYSIFGWTKNAGHLISTAFAFLAALLWCRVGVLTRLGKLGAVCLAGLLVLAEPGFSAANQARSDAFVFFLMSLATVLALESSRRPWLGFFSGLVAALAFECHPAGFLAFFYVAAAFY